MQKIVFSTLLFLILIHVLGFYGLYNIITNSAYNNTLIYVQFLLLIFVGLSATAGGHRLFTHQSYEAVLPVHFIFMIGLGLGCTGSAFGWIRTHRTHHQYTDTDLDPHDARKGFWWSHFGWTIYTIKPDVQKARYLQNTKTLRFWKIHYIIDEYYTLFALLLNTCIPVFIMKCFNISNISYDQYLFTTVTRIMIGVNMAASVNSFAHVESIIGTKPWSKKCTAFDNLLISLFTWGEGWHNWHHYRSSDWRASGYRNHFIYFNPAAILIRTLAMFGLAYNLVETHENKHDKVDFIKNKGKYIIRFKK